MFSTPPLLALLLLAPSCTTIPNVRAISPAGRPQYGGVWHDTNDSGAGYLSPSEMMDALTAQQARSCVPVPGFNICSHDQSKGTKASLPKRSAAVCFQDADWVKTRTALESACRILGNHCTYEMQQALGNADTAKQFLDSKQ